MKFDILDSISDSLRTIRDVVKKKAGNIKFTGLTDAPREKGKENVAVEPVKPELPNMDLSVEGYVVLDVDLDKPIIKAIEEDFSDYREIRAADKTVEPEMTFVYSSPTDIFANAMPSLPSGPIDFNHVEIKPVSVSVFGLYTEGDHECDEIDGGCTEIATVAQPEMLTNLAATSDVSVQEPTSQALVYEPQEARALTVIENPLFSDYVPEEKKVEVEAFDIGDISFAKAFSYLEKSAEADISYADAFAMFDDIIAVNTRCEKISKVIDTIISDVSAVNEISFAKAFSYLEKSAEADISYADAFAMFNDIIDESVTETECYVEDVDRFYSKTGYFTVGRGDRICTYGSTLSFWF